MSEVALPAHIAAALDRLTVPPLPIGFGDRLLARIETGDLPEDAVAPSVALPELRRPVRAAGWRRSGRIVMVAAAFGLATATAAASGVFGDAVYIPVVSDALAKADLVALPAKEPQRKKSVVAVKTKTDFPPSEQVAEPLGKDLVVQKMADLRKDPAYRALSPEQKVARLKLEIADMVASGKVTTADIKAARQQWHDARKVRGEGQYKKDSPLLKQRAAEFKKRENRPDPKLLSPVQKAKIRDAYAQLSPEQQSELRNLRQKRQMARPAERRAINEEIRAFWKRAGGKPAAQDADANANSTQP